MVSPAGFKSAKIGFKSRCVIVLFLSAAACVGYNQSDAAYEKYSIYEQGRSALKNYGCARCHTIPGVVGADGNIGPSLERIATRNYIAGVLPNTPQNMRRWITNPPAVDEQTAMPKLNLSPQDLHTILVYLDTLR
jgi:cytochrome c